MIKALYKNLKGVSLIETMVSLSIFIVISFMVYDYIKIGFKTSQFESEQGTAIQEARKAMETIAKDIRMAADSVSGSYAISQADAQELIVYSDVIQNNENETERVKFYIDTTENELKKVITEFSTSTGEYNFNRSTSTISKYVNNQSEPLFYYYDNNGATTTSIEDIRRIRFSIKINVTPAISPNDYYVESDVTLRNKKDNL